jgi:hypothetical protein
MKIICIHSLKILVFISLVLTTILHAHADASDVRQAIIDEAATHLGVQYSQPARNSGHASGNPTAFDCSSFISYVYAAAGVELNSGLTGSGNAETTVSLRNKIDFIDPGSLLPGDFLYYDYAIDGLNFRHVVLFLGGAGCDPANSATWSSCKTIESGNIYAAGEDSVHLGDLNYALTGAAARWFQGGARVKAEYWPDNENGSDPNTVYIDPVFSTNPITSPQRPPATPYVPPQAPDVNPRGFVLDLGPAEGLDAILKRLLITIIEVGGSILVVMIVVSGFLYVTSGGQEDKLRRAKRSLTYTFIGGAIVLGAYVIALSVADTLSLV